MTIAHQTADVTRVGVAFHRRHSRAERDQIGLELSERRPTIARREATLDLPYVLAERSEHRVDARRRVRLIKTARDGLSAGSRIASVDPDSESLKCRVEVTHPLIDLVDLAVAGLLRC
jgi:hypothetical protein